MAVTNDQLSKTSGAIGILASPYTNIGLTLLNFIAAGSVILGGGGDTVYTGNTAPTQFYESGSFLTYQEVALSASGSRNLTGNIQVSSKFQSGGVLDAYAVECNNQLLRTTGSLVVNQPVTKSAITTGNSVRNHIGILTGSVIRSSTGATGLKLIASSYMSFITNSSGGSPVISGTPAYWNQCKLKVWTHAKFGR